MSRPDFAALPASMLDEPPQVLLDWGRTLLADAGYRVIAAEPELRRRPWSTVARLATDRGPVWIKGNARDFGVEAALLDLLHRYTPDRIVPLIGVDPVHCRMVMVDGGTPLSGTGHVPESDWATLLTDYAALQTALAPRHAELLAIGLLDVTPARLTGWFQAALDRVQGEPALRGLLTGAELVALRAGVPTTEALAAELAGDGLPMTVEHNDLHRTNVVDAGPGHGLRIFDWGDAVVTHPFMGLRRTVQWATEQDGPPIRADRLRDAFLVAWSPLGDIPPWMRRSEVLAGALSPVVAAASWLRMPLADNPAWAGKFVGFLTDHARQATALTQGRS